MSELLKVSSNPHVRARMKTDNIMLLVLIALLPSAFFGVVNFGLRSLAVLAVSVVSAVLTEYLYDAQKNHHRRFQRSGDGSSSGTEPALDGAPLAAGHRKCVCDPFCQTAFRRPGAELYEPGSGRKMLSSDFLCGKNDGFHLGWSFKRHPSGSFEGRSICTGSGYVSWKDGGNHRRDFCDRYSYRRSSTFGFRVPTSCPLPSVPCFLAVMAWTLAFFSQSSAEVA